MKFDIPVYDIDIFKEYKNSGIIVSRFGHYAKEYKHLHTPHRHSFYHLVYFTKGAGLQHIDFKEYPVSPGLIYFMTPGQVHSWSFTEEVDGYIINFSQAYFSSFLSNPQYLQNFNFFDDLATDTVYVLPEHSRETIISIFEGILVEGKDHGPFHEDMVRISMLNIFIQVSRAMELKHPVQINAHNQKLLISFKKFIEANFMKLRFPKQYAELLFITPNHLNALTNDLLGISAGELIRERIILEAKRLLINMDLSVSDISNKLSFNDESYFIKFFKKQTGFTPNKFRKQN
ncbi:AraC family transcriptional regulator [Pedobacter immunditicola]|uniref:AraC family transcriptional regulator n=1 Tax=Pedobacter immunditicola TaxID=3133440 RepID=UPI00309A4263